VGHFSSRYTPRSAVDCMRHRDELLRSFQAATAQEPQRYLLRQIADLPVEPDFDQVVDLLRRTATSQDSSLAPFAGSVLGRILPRFLAYDYGIVLQGTPATGEAKGVSTDCAVPLQEEGPEDSWMCFPKLPPNELVQVAEAWTNAGSHLLEDCIGPLIQAAGSSEEADRATIYRCLSRYRHPKARTHLINAAKNDVLAAMAIGETADPDALDLLLDAVRQPGPMQCGLVRLLGFYPSRRTVIELRHALKSRDSGIRSAAAIALEGFGQFDPVALAQPLLEKVSDRWPLVQALDSLGRCAAPKAVGDLASVWRSSRDPQVQVAALRSANNLGGKAACLLCLEALETGSEHVQAVALEGLARLGLPPKLIESQLLSLMDSPCVHLALNASFVLARHDPILISRKVVSWLREGDDEDRLAGAHLLSCIRSDTGQRIAITLANKDPAPAVRMELIRGLSKYPAGQAGPALEACLDQPDDQVRAWAFRLLARTHHLHPSELSVLVSNLINKESHSGIRAGLVRELGRIGDVEACSIVSRALRSEEPDSVTAAAQALALAGDRKLAGGLISIGESGCPAARAAVAQALWAVGDQRCVPIMNRLFSEGGLALRHGIRVLEEIFHLLPQLPRSRRHDSLRGQLAGHVLSKEYQAFAREQPERSTRLVFPTARSYVDVAMSGRVLHSLAAIPLELDIPPKMSPPKRQRPPSSRMSDSWIFVQEPVTGPWSIRQTVTVLGLILVLFAGLFIREWLRFDPRSVVTERTRGMTLIEGSGLKVLSVEGDAKVKPRRQSLSSVSPGQSLTMPAVLSTGPGSRLVTGVRLHQNELSLGPDSSLSIETLSGTKSSSHYTVKGSDLTGSCIVRFVVGDPRVVLELLGCRLEAGRTIASVVVRGQTVSITVAWRYVTWKDKLGSVLVKAGQQIEWEMGKPMPSPTEVNLQRVSLR